ncbi:MAG: hypothetical protein WCI61_00110 [Chloroflexota bacterium]
MITTRLAPTLTRGSATLSTMRWLWDPRGAVLQAIPEACHLDLTGGVPLATGRFGQGRRVEAATTNLLTNPSFETNTSGWGTDGSNTIAATSAVASAGTKALRCTYQSDRRLLTLSSGGYSGLAAGSVTFSIDVRIAAAYDGTSLGVYFASFAGSSGDASPGTLLDMAVRDAWQRVQVTSVIAAGDLTGNVVLREHGTLPTAGRYVDVDAAQLEQAAAASSYADGSLGSGYAWSGMAHASTSTRAEGAAMCGRRLLDAERAGVAFAVRCPWSGAETVERTLIDIRDGAEVMRVVRTSAAQWRVEHVAGGVTSSVEVAATHSAGADVTVVAGWDGPHLVLDVDGTRATGTRAVVPAIGASATTVMARGASGGSSLDATVDLAIGFATPPGAGRARPLARLTAMPAWRGV